MELTFDQPSTQICNGALANFTMSELMMTINTLSNQRIMVIHGDLYPRTKKKKCIKFIWKNQPLNPTKPRQVHQATIQECQRPNHVSHRSTQTFDRHPQAAPLEAGVSCFDFKGRAVKLVSQFKCWKLECTKNAWRKHHKSHSNMLNSNKFTASPSKCSIMSPLISILDSKNEAYLPDGSDGNVEFSKSWRPMVEKIVANRESMFITSWTQWDEWENHERSTFKFQVYLI